MDVRRWSRLALVMSALVLLATTGCAKRTVENPGGATASPSPSAAAGPVKITRTGGIAGVRQVIVVSPDGSWTYTDQRTAVTAEGKLSTAEAAQFSGMVSGPALLAELAKPPATSGCADTFHYLIEMAGQSVQFDECDQAAKPTVMAMINALSAATAF